MNIIAPRHILLVLAHPQPTSLCSHLAQTVIVALRDLGWSVDVLDLYGEGFEAAMNREERSAYYSHAARAASEHQARLVAATDLVLVFPTWWFSFPAILKGWFDRVWAPGVAFAHGTPITPLLTGLRSCTVVTTMGSPWWVDRIVMRQPVRRVLKTAILGACAPKARFRMLTLHDAEAVRPRRLAAFERRMIAALRQL
ncbi:NAD(P)H dehydrogenase (quinone) [Devosia sp. UYZn731]|uniref:NAD(P)H-dependent oxidoreductase n=1 Tax=Devosia sp. UYZn731 TaxID=3156345 RepID=UPI0033997C50